MADPGGPGRLMPHSSQHPAQYSTHTQPHGVASASEAQYMGVPQPFYFHPTLTAFLPGPPPPRHSFVVSSAAPLPAAPPPAGVPPCHTHHMTGRSVAAPTSAPTAPSPPPGAPSNIPAAPPDAPPGFLLSNLCIPPSYASVGVLPPGAHERLASPAVVPAPPADAGTTGVGKSSGGSGVLTCPGQQGAACVGKVAGAAVISQPASGGGPSSAKKESYCFDIRSKPNISNAPPPPPNLGAGSPSGGRARAHPVGLSTAEEVTGSRNNTVQRASETGAAGPQTGCARAARLQHSGKSGNLAVRGDDCHEQTPLPGSGAKKDSDSYVSCGVTRSTETRSTISGGTQPYHQQECLSRQTRPPSRSSDSRNNRRDSGTQRADDTSLRGEMPQQKLQQHAGGLEGTRPADTQQLCGNGGRGSGPSEKMSTNSETLEEKRGQFDRHQTISLGGPATVGAARDGPSSVSFSEKGGSEGGNVEDGARKSDGKAGVRAATPAAGAPGPSLTKHERRFREKSAADGAGEREAGNEEHEARKPGTLLEAVADESIAGSSERRNSFMSGGESFGTGTMRAVRTTQESGRGRIVGIPCIGQPLLPPRKQQHQTGSFQKQHAPSREQLLHTQGWRGATASCRSLSREGGRGAGRPHSYGGAPGGHRYPVGLNSRQSADVGGSRPTPARGGFFIGGSRRSGGLGSRSGCERERDVGRAGKRRRQSNSGERRRSEGRRDTRSRCSSSVERRRRRSSPSIQRPVNEDVRSSRSSSIASLVLGEDEMEGERRLGGGAVELGGGTAKDNGHDAEMELERNNSISMGRRSPSPRPLRDGRRCSVPPSPASDMFTDVQEAEGHSSSNCSGDADFVHAGMMQSEQNVSRISEDGGQSRNDHPRVRTRPGISSTRCNSGERGSVDIGVLRREEALDRSTHPPPPPLPPSPQEQAAQPTGGFSFGANPFSRLGGSSASMRTEKAQGGGGGGAGEDVAADAQVAIHGTDTSGPGSGASLKPGQSSTVPSTEIKEGAPTIRGPLFDLWVPTTFHPLCPERVRLVLGPKGRTHKEMEQFTKTRVQLYGRELVRDTSKHEYDPFRDNQPLHLVVGDKVRRGEWSDASVQQMKEKLKVFLEQLVQRTWPRTEQRQPVSFYDKQMHLGPSAGLLVYVDALGKWDESPPRDLFPCLVYHPTRCAGGITPASQQPQGGTSTMPSTPESSGVATADGDSRVRRTHDKETGATYKGDTSLLLNCTPPLCLLLLTLQAAHGLLVEEGVQELADLPLAYEKKWEVRFLFRREDFQAAGSPPFTTERDEPIATPVDTMIYTPEGHMHEEAVSVLTRFVKEFPEVFDFIEGDTSDPASSSSVSETPAHSTRKIKARDQPDFASVAQRFKSTDPWLQGCQSQAGMSVYAPALS